MLGECVREWARTKSSIMSMPVPNCCTGPWPTIAAVVMRKIGKMRQQKPGDW